MPLRPIEPMRYERFVELLGDSVAAIVGALEANGLGGWQQALERYRFDG